MKKKILQFWEAIKNFPKKGEQGPIKVTEYSQPYVLQTRMAQANITHGQTVIADLPYVRLKEEEKGMSIYFCPLGYVNVVRQISPGDGKDLPREVVLKGFKKMEPGAYRVKNVELFSNGKIQVKATEETKW